MTKKIIKDIILISLIINSLLCLIYNIYNNIKNQEILDEITSKTINNKEMQTLTFDVQKGYDNYSFIQNQYSLGKRAILVDNLMISIISLIIGIFASLISSMEDSKLIKYFLIFILGNICFNIPLTMFYSKLYNIAFINGYSIILKNTFVLYTLIFFICLFIKILIAQYHIKKINNILKNKK